MGIACRAVRIRDEVFSVLDQGRELALQSPRVAIVLVLHRADLWISGRPGNVVALACTMRERVRQGLVRVRGKVAIKRLDRLGRDQ